LSFPSHLKLLWAYLTTPLRPNVHGGYFEGKLSQELIYRLACLGFNGTVGAYGSVTAIGDACESKQIRVLLSPFLPWPAGRVHPPAQAAIPPHPAGIESP